MIRLYCIKIFFIVFFLAILARLFYWQILQAEFLQAQAEGQHLVEAKVGALRGSIRYLDGSILASSNPSFRLFGLPKIIPEDKKLELAYTLAKVLTEDTQDEVDTEAKDLLEQLSQPLYWVLLKKNISFNQKLKIEKLNLKGLGFEQTSTRFYPEGSSSAHVLGFVGSDAKGEDIGYFGLEGFYEGELKGVAGVFKVERDALGVPISIGQFQTDDVKNGKDLILNIDRTVQFIVEKILKGGLEKYGAKVASAVVMDPKTGAILALASFPNYDPAKFYNFPNIYQNPIVADQYEPGSTFKVLVMSAAINEDVVKPETQCDICSGPIQLGGFSLRTWNNKYSPNTTMQDVIIHSDNTGMVFTGLKIGVDKFYEYLVNFGLGNLTGVDLQDESAPDLRPKEEWREIDLATSSFGQGIAVTPIQMVRAVAAIANGGYLMEPHVVKFIKDENGTFQIHPKVIRQVIKESTAKIITEMMVKAASEGEAKWAKPKGFKIAGKTGTAQIPIAGHYDPEKTIASFVGFAPADDPKFVMLVRYDQPSTSPYGSETAAPTFFEIAKQLFNYYKIAPSQ